MPARGGPDSGIRDHQINNSKLAAKVPRGLAQTLRAEHIARQRDRAPAGINNFCFNLTQGFDAPRKQANRRAPPGQLYCQPTPNSTRGASNKYYFIFPVHESSGFAFLFESAGKIVRRSWKPIPVEDDL